MRVISGTARGHTLKAPKGMSTRPMADKVKGAVFSMLSNLLAQLDRDWGRVLDLYAGTGSIGIEALSRGAEWADFVEMNAGVCRIISENLEHTRLTAQSRVNNRAVSSFLNAPPTGIAGKKRAAGGLHRRKGGTWRDPKQLLPPEEDLAVAAQISEVAQADNKYDIIFLDPPYADPKIPDTIEHLARSGLLKPGSLIVVGHTPRLALADSYTGITKQETPDAEATVLNRIRFRQHGDSAFSIYIEGEPPAVLLKDSIIDEDLYEE